VGGQDMPKMYRLDLSKSILPRTICVICGSTGQGQELSGADHEGKLAFCPESRVAISVATSAHFLAVWRLGCPEHKGTAKTPLTQKPCKTQGVVTSVGFRSSEAIAAKGNRTPDTRIFRR